MSRVCVYRREGTPNWQLSWRDPQTGRRLRRSSKTPDRREAEREAARWQLEIEQQRATDGSMPWDVFVTQYAERHLSQLRQASEQAALSSLAIFERHAQPRTVGSVSSQMIVEWLAAYRTGHAEQTVRSRLGALRAALRWAADVGIIAAPPTIPRQRKTGKRAGGKGRAITPHEFALMLRATREVVGRKNAKQWRRSLRCLWLSGLRLGEAITLDWSDPLAIRPELDGEHPMLLVPGEQNKDGDDHLVPITPDWRVWLERTPRDQRSGRVLQFPKRKQRGCHSERQITDFASKTITAIGKASGVIVNTRSGKHASAHDLRRSFGLRWSRQVMPQVLQLLMRHDDISTTMKYYVGSDVLHAAEVVAATGTQFGTQLHQKT